MTKAIKFNLILDGKPVRDLEGLQENFDLYDLFTHYKNGVFQRWLEVRGYNEHLKEMLCVSAKNELGLAESLVRIFGGEKNVKKVKSVMLKFQSKRKYEKTPKKSKLEVS